MTENLEKYKKIVEKFAEKVQPMIDAVEDGFQASDIVVFIVAFNTISTKLKEQVDNLRNIKDTDRVKVYLYLKTAIINKALEESNLSEDKKTQIRSYFSEDGLIDKITNGLNDMWNVELDKMDVNDDDIVTKDEFKKYWMTRCHCFGNKNCQKCCVDTKMSCCWPIFSGGKDHIDIGDDEFEDDL